MVNVVFAGKDTYLILQRRFDKLRKAGVKVMIDGYTCSLHVKWIVLGHQYFLNIPLYLMPVVIALTILVLAECDMPNLSLSMRCALAPQREPHMGTQVKDMCNLAGCGYVKVSWYAACLGYDLKKKLVRSVSSVGTALSTCWMKWCGLAAELTTYRCKCFCLHLVLNSKNSKIH
jgi:hypothetical protein